MTTKPTTFNVTSAFLFYLLLLCFHHTTYAGNYGTLLVNRCNSLRGNGRCVASSDCCRAVGGAPEQEVGSGTVSASSGAYGNNKPQQPRCGPYEVCCLISPTARSNSCQQCGIKGVDNDSPGPPTLPQSYYTSTTTTTLSPANYENLFNQYSGGYNKNSAGTFSAKPSSDFTGRTAGGGDEDNKDAALVQNAAAVAEGDSIFTPKKFWGRIVGGTDSAQREWCWQAALVDRDTGMVFGGGVLIAQNWVLTAAHKIRHRSSDNFVVVLGKTDFADQNEDSRIAVAQAIIVHKKFNETTFENDIGLIKIADAPCETGNICTICIDDETINGSPMQIEYDLNRLYGSGSSSSKQPAGYGRYRGMRRQSRAVLAPQTTTSENIAIQSGNITVNLVVDNSKAVTTSSSSSVSNNNNKTERIIPTNSDDYNFGSALPGSPALYSSYGNGGGGGGDKTTVTIQTNSYAPASSSSSSGGQEYVVDESSGSLSSYSRHQSNAQYDRCVITGWGATADHVASPVLQKADVSILGPNTCTAAMLAANVKNYTTPPNMFCARGLPGAPNVNTCDGDGGGPLVCRANGIWYVKGITTLGVQDCQNVVAPALFLDVAVYKEWIERNLRGNALPQPPSGGAKSGGVVYG